ncbi:uncharacterized protein PAC_02018 [Phialocephala subalpina]|uniref:Uncharacterized protein n=1 Tax=Phialocephala subalpina TaxID=576137 RepID=A0A1L7WH86_9HELO|nr:uncharacterized protein PAC_02018 [Phialocephala subalpina]
MAQNAQTNNGVGSGLPPGEPDSLAFILWKTRWHERIAVLTLREEGMKWGEIEKKFADLGTTKTVGGWRTTYDRASVEVHAMGMAAIADKADEITRLFNKAWEFDNIYQLSEADYAGTWGRISQAMRNWGSVEQWSAQKVKYAWDHGVSSRYPQVVLCLYPPKDENMDGLQEDTSDAVVENTDGHHFLGEDISDVVVENMDGHHFLGEDISDELASALHYLGC